MEGSKMNRAMVAPLLLLNLAMFSIALGFSGWMLNREIERGSYGGNGATPFLVLFSLLAGMVGIASGVTGLHHHFRVGTCHTKAAAQAASSISWMLLILAFCLAWKEIRIGGRGIRYKVLESFIIILTATKFLETLTYYLGENSRAPSRRAEIVVENPQYTSPV